MAYRLIKSNLGHDQTADLVERIKQGRYRVTSHGMVTVRDPEEGHPTFPFYLWDNTLKLEVERQIPLPVGYVWAGNAGLINIDKPFLVDYHRELEEIMLG